MKIAVVGCSFAGLSFSYFLSKAKSDIDLTLFERKSKIGSLQTSACCTTLETLKELDAEKSILRKFHRWKLHYKDREFKFRTECFATFDYEKLCQVLSKRIDGRIMLRNNADVEKLKDDYDIVIDASGWSSRIDRNKRLAFGLECEIEVDDLSSDMFHLFVGKDIIEGGYGWAFPVSENKFRVGVCSYKKLDFSKKLDEFLLYKFGRKGNFKTVGGFIAYGLSSNIIRDNIICLGDSASQTAPVTYEGIKPAVLFSKYLSGLVCDYHTGRISFDELVDSYLSKAKRSLAYEAVLRTEGMFLNPNYLVYLLMKGILNAYGIRVKGK